MRCPKCEKGEITEVLVNDSAVKGSMCDTCGTVWLEDEKIQPHTGHVGSALGKLGDQEFRFEDIPQKDEDAKVVKYPVCK